MNLPEPPVRRRWRGIAELLVSAPLLVSCALIPEGWIESIDPPRNPIILEETERAQIRSQMKDLVSQGFAAGLYVGVYRDNDQVFSAVEGWADLERGQKLREDTIFRIYSMTKPVTAVAVLSLVEQGLIGLDDPVPTWIPEFDDATVYVSGDSLETLEVKPAQVTMTIRHLLTNTSGITFKYGASGVITELYHLRGIDSGSSFDGPPGDGSSRVTSAGEFAQRIAGIPLLNEPGARFVYGNSIDVLGHIVEVVSGMSLDDYMKTLIFQPLGMGDTSFRVGAGDLSRFAAAYAIVDGSPAPPHFAVLTRETFWPTDGKLALLDDPVTSPYLTDRTIQFGAAGLVSTMSDYLRFAQMLGNKGVLDGVRVISENSVKMMTQNQLSPEAFDNRDFKGEGFTYGLGVGIFDETNSLDIPEGAFFWGGAASTNFLVDSDSGTVVIMMAQLFGPELRPFWYEVLEATFSTMQEDVLAQ